MSQPTPPPTTAQPPPPEAEHPVAAAIVALGGVSLLALAMAHRRRQQMLALAAVRRVRGLWRFVDPRSPQASQASWASANSQAVGLVTAAQVAAATGVAEYVAAALRMQGRSPEPEGLVPAAAFAGAAADGRALDTLLSYPAFEASAFADEGMSAEQASAVGLRHLERIVGNEVADAARVGTGVALVNDRAASGWVRMLTPPSCARCVILAGTVYRTNRGADFKRHPLCDCVALPVAEMVEVPDPLDIFNAMSDEELRSAGWSQADVAAIREHGADIYQVTNAHREIYKTQVAGQQVKATRVGTTRRGLAGQRLGKRGVRLTPSSLYAEAQRLGWSRDELLKALRLHGYIL